MYWMKAKQEFEKANSLGFLEIMQKFEDVHRLLIEEVYSGRLKTIEDISGLELMCLESLERIEEDLSERQGKLNASKALEHANFSKKRAHNESCGKTLFNISEKSYEQTNYNNDDSSSDLFED